MRYLVQARERMSLKGYIFLSFARNMRRNIGKCINKNLSSKYSQNLLDTAIDAFKTASKRPIQKTAKATRDQKARIKKLIAE